MDYIKKAWLISGKLKPKDYFTVGSIFWVCVFLISFGATIWTSISQIKLTGGFFTAIFSDLLFIAVVIIFSYLNIRLNPFVAKHIDSNFKSGNVDDIGERMKNAYNSEVNNGPQIKNINSSTFTGNPNDLYESNFEMKARAISEEANEGLISLTEVLILRPFLKILVWPVSFLVSWIFLKQYVEEYNKAMAEESDVNINNDIDSFFNTKNTNTEGINNPNESFKSFDKVNATTNDIKNDGMKENRDNYQQNIESTDNAFTIKGNSQINAFCPNCGAEVDSDSNFCTQCGHKLE